MAWTSSISFNKNSSVSKSRYSLTYSHIHLLFDLFFTLNKTHSFSTATGAGFDQ